MRNIGNHQGRNGRLMSVVLTFLFFQYSIKTIDHTPESLTAAADDKYVFYSASVSCNVMILYDEARDYSVPELENNSYGSRLLIGFENS